MPVSLSGLNMVCKRIAAYFIATFVMSLFAGESMAKVSSPQWGKVFLQGVINECACSISSGDEEQSVDLSAFSEVPPSGKSQTKTFSIFFTSCIPVPASAHDMDVNKRFRTTFSNQVFGNTDESVDMPSGIQILDSERNIASPGESVVIKNNALKNRMQVLYYIQVANEKRKTVNRPLSSSVRFNVDYY